MNNFMQMPQIFIRIWKTVWRSKPPKNWNNQTSRENPLCQQRIHPSIPQQNSHLASSTESNSQCLNLDAKQIIKLIRSQISVKQSQS